ncbi:hypothetical protein C6N75_08470 [Streptomyces solincola]|uniref:Uncharacterized protein n=1 Tax=Streptomyces solincola TaxID=2100817 RepID=A0A2S9PZ72_9ACTN|nr:hypothetical protein [Streptomyces solincola]PRH79657.1 hypothetical protein C6N75_08470 [Streptomyces solincola]
MSSTPTPTSPSAAMFGDVTLQAAAALAQDAYTPVWIAASGEQTAGELVARHLESTIALLEQDGWARTYTPWSTPDLPAADDPNASVEDMVRELIRAIRDDAPAGQPRCLSMALNHVGSGTDGDGDTRDIAHTVLDLIMRAHTGHDTARAMAWAERAHRTLPEVTALLTAGARFARAHGPSAAVAI